MMALESSGPKCEPDSTAYYKQDWGWVAYPTWDGDKLFLSTGGLCRNHSFHPQETLLVPAIAFHICDTRPVVSCHHPIPWQLLPWTREPWLPLDTAHQKL